MFRDKLCFLYINTKGQLGIHELESVSETPLYYQGPTKSGYRTFRKDRIINIAESSSALIDHLNSFDVNSWLQSYKADTADKVSVAPVAKRTAKVCFTGFKKERKAELEAIAVDAGIQLLTGASNNLTYLCCGMNAGPAKMEKARALGALILSETEFLHMLETGEVPDFSLLVELN